MTPSKQKGTAWETRIVDYAHDTALHAFRRPLSGAKDKGDIDIVLSTGQQIVVEAKNCQRVELAQWVDEAEVEAVNAGALLGVVWHHRRGKASPGDGFVTMSGDTFVRLLKETQRG